MKSMCLLKVVKGSLYIRFMLKIIDLAKYLFMYELELG